MQAANPANGLIADTSRESSPASIGVVGFALSTYPVAVERVDAAGGRGRTHARDVAFLPRQRSERPPGGHGFQGFPVKTFTIPMHDVDRAIADGEEVGFVKIHVNERTDRILGATIVARHAGEMINEITLAMVAGIGLGTHARVVHAYPTQAEAVKKAADAYNRTRLTPTIRSLLRRWLQW